VSSIISGKISEPYLPQTILGELATGTRMLYRAKNEWRQAVISRDFGSKVELTIANPKGRNYRIRKAKDSQIFSIKNILVLMPDYPRLLSGPLAKYDNRW
jgi:hypothetical protein